MKAAAKVQKTVLFLGIEKIYSLPTITLTVECGFVTKKGHVEA